jgi:hypothetical protein
MRNSRDARPRCVGRTKRGRLRRAAGPFAIEGRRRPSISCPTKTSKPTPSNRFATLIKSLGLPCMMHGPRASGHGFSGSEPRGESACRRGVIGSGSLSRPPFSPPSTTKQRPPHRPWGGMSDRPESEKARPYRRRTGFPSLFSLAANPGCLPPNRHGRKPSLRLIRLRPGSNALGLGPSSSATAPGGRPLDVPPARRSERSASPTTPSHAAAVAGRATARDGSLRRTGFRIGGRSDERRSAPARARSRRASACRPRHRRRPQPLCGDVGRQASCARHRSFMSGRSPVKKDSDDFPRNGGVRIGREQFDEGIAKGQRRTSRESGGDGGHAEPPFPTSADEHDNGEVNEPTTASKPLPISDFIAFSPDHTYMHRSIAARLPSWPGFGRDGHPCARSRKGRRRTISSRSLRPNRTRSSRRFTQGDARHPDDTRGGRRVVDRAGERGARASRAASR